MALKCGIVGLPNVGKSTLFNALSSAKALAANYPFATKEPNVGVITVPDVRLQKLTEIVQPQKTLPTTVDIVDIAGLIKGASKGEGLGNQFLANIREVQAILHVIRCFEDDNVVHVDGNVNPVRDKEIIDTELLLKDIDTVEKRLEKLKKASKSGDKQAVKNVETGQIILNHLEEGNPARTLQFESQDQIELLEDLLLITHKPVMYVLNVDEASVIEGNEFTKSLVPAIKAEASNFLLISAGIEADLTELDDQEERKEFLSDMGLSEPGVNRLIQEAYRMLNLITYFTAGEKEVRAWTVKNGSTAPQAAGVIHTDFEKGFIRAEVISYQDFIQFGAEFAVKEAGKLKIEGKEYIVEDGDIMHFLFNV